MVDDADDDRAAQLAGVGLIGRTLDVVDDADDDRAAQLAGVGLIGRTLDVVMLVA